MATSTVPVTSQIAVATWNNRSRRVIVLVIGIIALSAADLVVTLEFLRAQWLMEANPIAAYLIRTTQSPWALAAFKAITVGICVGLLYRVRHSMAGEVASWAAIGILTVMSLMWHSYAQHFDGRDEMVLAHISANDDGLLSLP